jgi:L-alanine-DL-glutamate epimerase-like enolase superfamily enzyme
MHQDVRASDGAEASAHLRSSPPAIVANSRILRFSFPRDRLIGDSQVRIDMAHIGVLEIETADGLVGTGFFQDLFHPLPDEAELQRQFDAQVFEGVRGQPVAALLNRISRPRGGNNRPVSFGFSEALDQALWDLHAQSLALPLWRLLGGSEPRVRTYASGLDFHLSDRHFVEFFRTVRELGYEAFKIKVGHPDIRWDLNRLNLLREATGPDVLVMVDANEAWTPKEAIRRLAMFRDAGHPIYWVEDPCLRDDFEGLRQVGEAAAFTHLNTGEYLDLSGKRRLIAARAVDILNVHGRISDVLKAGWLAGEHGIEMSLGNTAMELGVHLAAALPECRWLEYSFHNTAFLLEEPVRIEGGWAYAPDRPGHGLKISDMARREFRTPASGDVVPRSRVPAPPVPLSLSSAAAE